MLLLSGVWFSLEGTSAAARVLSQVFPVTHMVGAARRVMIDGAGIVEVLPEVGLLAALAAMLLVTAALLFRWE
jgi:ABC-type multidrug transport system permease subunit